MKTATEIMTEQQKHSSIELIVNEEIIIKITDGKFYYKGEEIDDVYNVYQRFNEWLGLAEKQKNPI